LESLKKPQRKKEIAEDRQVGYAKQGEVRTQLRRRYHGGHHDEEAEDSQQGFRGHDRAKNLRSLTRISSADRDPPGSRQVKAIFDETDEIPVEGRRIRDQSEMFDA